MKTIISALLLASLSTVALADAPKMDKTAPKTDMAPKADAPKADAPKTDAKATDKTAPKTDAKATDKTAPKKDVKAPATK